MTSHAYQKRLVKEFKAIQNSQLPGVDFLGDESELICFLFRIRIPNNELYPEADFYKLCIKITPGYPVDSPEVTFITPTNADNSVKVPMHPHIYSNGHICLNLLGNDWTPACGVETIVLSIQSMLANNSVNERPPGDDRYVKYGPSNPKKTHFVYHDDSI